MIKEKFNEFEVDGIKFHYDGELFVGWYDKGKFILINPLEIPFTEKEDEEIVILADDEEDMIENKQRAFEWLKNKIKESK